MNKMKSKNYMCIAGIGCWLQLTSRLAHLKHFCRINSKATHPPPTPPPPLILRLQEQALQGINLVLYRVLPETATAGTVEVIGTSTVSTGVAAGVLFLSSSPRVGVFGAGVSSGVGSGVGKVFRVFLVSRPPSNFGFSVSAGATNTVGTGTGVGEATRAPAQAQDSVMLQVPLQRALV